MPNPENRRGIEEAAKPGRPDRLVPGHLGEKRTETKIDKKSKRTEAQQAYEQRAEQISRAPDLEGMLRKHATETGEPAPEGLNLSLIEIENFQRRVREAEDLRDVIKKSTDPREQAKAAELYNEKKKMIQSYLDDGLNTGSLASHAEMVVQPISSSLEIMTSRYKLPTMVVRH